MSETVHVEYTETEMQKAHRAYLFNVLLLTFWLLLGVVLTIVFLVQRHKALSILTAILCGAPAIFYWGVWGLDVTRYERFMRGIRTGLHASFNGTVVDKGQVVVHDELPMQSFTVLDEDQQTERLCYRDIFKEDAALVNLNVGDRYRFTTHSQAIIGLDPYGSVDAEEED